MAGDLIFLKLGGSLLTDKTEKEALRSDILAQLAQEIAAARLTNPLLKLVLGHGSGSFGHFAGKKHGTRDGVHGWQQWFGFAEVGDAAARLNRHVIAALLSAGVPAVGIPASASASVVDGRIVEMATKSIAAALEAGILPVVFGDVAFDEIRGGTIVSTEEIMEYLAAHFHPQYFLLAGETAGVFDLHGGVIPKITRASLPEVMSALGGSRGMDVTGGMASKVIAMLDLVDHHPGLSVRIFSGLEPGLLPRVLNDSTLPVGTLIEYA